MIDCKRKDSALPEISTGGGRNGRAGPGVCGSRTSWKGSGLGAGCHTGTRSYTLRYVHADLFLRSSTYRRALRELLHVDIMEVAAERSCLLRSFLIRELNVSATAEEHNRLCRHSSLFLNHACQAWRGQCQAKCSDGYREQRFH